MNFLDKLRPLALLLLRLGLGVIFIYYGYAKLFSQAGQNVKFFQQIGFPSYMSYVVGIVELFGGALLIVGLFARIAGLLLAGTMAVAIWKVGLGKGVLAVPEYQFPLAVGAGCLVVAAFGAGLLSLDFAIFRQKA